MSTSPLLTNLSLLLLRLHRTKVCHLSTEIELKHYNTPVLVETSIVLLHGKLVNHIALYALKIRRVIKLAELTHPSSRKLLRAGVDSITIMWSYNVSLESTAPDTNYNTSKGKLCYAPVSQMGRNDRKTNDSLDFDMTCPVVIMRVPYQRENNSYTWLIPGNTTAATYFVRVYIDKANKHETAYGQSTNENKTTNLFQIDGVRDTLLIDINNSNVKRHFPPTPTLCCESGLPCCENSSSGKQEKEEGEMKMFQTILDTKE
ncbi:high-affinity nitrate transporter [Artemisia annua]|uniref:High-affinity nitrate transporter n=1 Tax=Artemisia annua TaxID=35608 RepID=A0A2U1QA31_ARTAN|nr:high-affinity nitrate transporter [Artemisia annua]